MPPRREDAPFSDTERRLAGSNRMCFSVVVVRTDGPRLVTSCSLFHREEEDWGAERSGGKVADTAAAEAAAAGNIDFPKPPSASDERVETCSFTFKAS